MDLLLNILLLLLGFAIAVVAIGGDTWNKASSLKHRITKRGWIAIVCLALSFSVGAIKEWRSADVKAQIEIERIKFGKDLKDTKSNLEDAAKQLKSTKDEIIQMQAILKSSDNALNSTLDLLATTRSEVATLRENIVGLERNEQKRAGRLLKSLDDGIAGAQSLIKKSIDEIKLTDLQLEQQRHQDAMLNIIQRTQEHISTRIAANQKSLITISSGETTNVKKRIVELQQEYNQLQKDKDKVTSKLDETQGQLKQTRSELTSAQKQWQQKYDQLLTDNKQTTSKLDDTQEQLKQTRSKLAAAQQQLSEPTDGSDALRQLQREYNQLLTDNKQTTSKLDDTQEQLKQTRSELTSAQQQWQQKYNQLKKENATLQSKLSDASKRKR